MYLCVPFTSLVGVDCLLFPLLLLQLRFLLLLELLYLLQTIYLCRRFLVCLVIDEFCVCVFLSKDDHCFSFQFDEQLANIHPDSVSFGRSTSREHLSRKMSWGSSQGAVARAVSLARCGKYRRISTFPNKLL